MVPGFTSTLGKTSLVKPLFCHLVSNPAGAPRPFGFTLDSVHLTNCVLCVAPVTRKVVLRYSADSEMLRLRPRPVSPTPLLTNQDDPSLSPHSPTR